MEILNRKAIKQQAREFIGIDRKWLYMALACLPLILIESALSSGTKIVKHFSENGEITTRTTSTGSSFVIWLFVPFTIAMAGYFLNHLRGTNPDWKSLYREGIDNFGVYFKVGVPTQIFTFLWTLVFIIPGIIKGFEWFFVHQIIHDNPNLTGKQARDLSKRMTNGFKGELFIMELSFILWYLLVAVTFGIALVYVTPYVECTTAMYYENLKHNALMSGIATLDEFGISPFTPEANPEYNPEMNTEPPVLYSYIERDLETNIETVVEEQVVEETIETEIIEETEKSSKEISE
ncbi:MAG: DUF975 family protein [Clostridia bacterium]|nr:DUF975 family protein [Clostridia bacterium]